MPSLTFDTLVVTFFSDTTAPAYAGVDQQLCTPMDSTTLAAAVPSLPAQGTWSVLSGTGNFSGLNDPLAVVTGLSIGDNVLLWTLDNGLAPTTVLQRIP